MWIMYTVDVIDKDNETTDDDDEKKKKQNDMVSIDLYHPFGCEKYHSFLFNWN